MNFIDTAASRETSPEIMSAILAVAGGDDTRADRVWNEPTIEEALAVWEIVTSNGVRNPSEYCWGADGARWASQLGVDR